MPRSKSRVFKKRKFVGIASKANEEPTPAESRPTSSTSSSRPRPESEPTVEFETKESSSSKKVSENMSRYKELCFKGDGKCFDIISIATIQILVDQIGRCAKCGALLSVSAENRKGLSFELLIECIGCKFAVRNPNGKILPSGRTEVNVRMAYAMRCTGQGEQAANTFCGLMNLPNPSAIKYFTKLLCDATKEVAELSMKRAAKESVRQENIDLGLGETDDNRDITIIIDGSWQKRGHTSQNGVVTAISSASGKVLDVEVLTKHCRCKKRFEKEHEQNCLANYQGSSGGMEVAGVKNIFLRSEPRFNVRYKNYLGDGDSASFPAVSELKPYGPDVTIEKLECIGHVQKRMGTRLRTLKSKKGKSKLSDGKTIGGRGRLTDAAIKQITTYYGLAIRRNTDSLDKMTNAVWAVYDHIRSSNQNLAHGKCPDDEHTWCKYKKAQKKNEVYDHKTHFHLPMVVMNEIRSIFDDLSTPQLMSKCLHGGTQNPSESLNNMIWSRIPKRVFVMKNTLELGVYEAVLCFNEGYISRCEVLRKLSIVPGVNCVNVLKEFDKMRIKKADKAIDKIAKKCRQETALAKRKLEDEFEEAEDPENPSYGAGMY